ncbi:STAS domain-containing protein [Streptomyces sp. NPDC051211]|uniref:STAS domain-containing protein n=1 Tax=Streptomyces sp. NPDC051211 TaxID=3154643 RepID=UPI00344D9E51
MRYMNNRSPQSGGRHAVSLTAHVASTACEATSVSSLTEPGGTGLLRLSGEFDQDAAPQVREALSTVRAVGARRTIVDLSGVVFADSSLLHVLLSAREEHALVLAGPLHSQLQRLFELTGTAGLFTFAEDPEAARLLPPPSPGEGVPG